jgi:SAM-dependent methyltransferase
MDYDPIKDSLGAFFNRNVYLRRIFYLIIDTLLLRTWHIHREIRKWKRKAPYNAHILDAGCGFGQYSYYLARQNKKWNVLAIDIKRDYIADCNDFFRKSNMQNIYCVKEDLTVFRKDQRFDLVLSVDVMEHIENDRQVLENLYHSLRPGGVLILSTPSDKGGSDAQITGESFIGEHVRDGYSVIDIREKLKTAGFTKVKIHYSYGIPGKIAWRMVMKWPMKLLNITRFFFILLPLYYLVVIIPVLLLHYMDTITPHRSGTGLIVRAEKA